MDAVIVTADSRKDLEKLVACEPLRRSFDRLIVVDNMSRDGSAEVARRAGAEVIQVTPRDGYARCVNLGVSHTTGPRFAVLNPDIAFCDEHVLPPLETHFDEDDVALVAPTLVLPDGRLQDSARRIPTPLDLVMRRSGINCRRGEIDSAGDVPWVVGACFVARRAAWDAIGGLDESYALYFEDVDLCWRLRQAGWKTRLDRTVRVEHKHGAASRKSILGRAARHHVVGAARFYRTNPRFIVSPRMPVVSAAARAAPAVRAPAAPAVPVRPAETVPAPAEAVPMRAVAAALVRAAVPARALAAAPSPAARVAAAVTTTPDLLGSLDYGGRDRSHAPLDPAPAHPAGAEPARWLADRDRIAGAGVDSELGRRLAAARWAPHAATHGLAAVRSRPACADASRWLPGRRATDAAVAA